MRLELPEFGGGGGGGGGGAWGSSKVVEGRKHEGKGEEGRDICCFVVLKGVWVWS